MAEPRDVLVDGFGRVREVVHAALRRQTPDDLAWRPAPGANTIGWLVWHLTRVQDDHVADAFDLPQVWTAHGWAERLDLPRPPGDTGYGDTAEQVGALRASADALAGYHDAVHARTVELLAGVDAADLDRIVDTSWDPPVTLGVRLVSVLSDDLQHAGQAAYVRGLARARG
ncbi:mycothiol transferase [Cellulomonas timonensis]|uniref:mycothiol transferase n=1 Tax=Cellulomonas timonensis TaxID=1689271 RepID=UPI000D528E33|nr:DinB family protein [Cellulomonas timonensis]